jgi:hypothetical protein
MSNIWTPPVITRFKELLKRGYYTYSDIAKMLSREFSVKLTKNACVGKGRRLSVALRSPPRKHVYTPRRKPAPKPAPHKPKPKKPGATPPNVPLMRLQPHHCRWPIGEQKPFLFCGEQKADGYSYCPKHAKISYVNWRERL